MSAKFGRTSPITFSAARLGNSGWHNTFGTRRQGLSQEHSDGDIGSSPTLAGSGKAQDREGPAVVTTDRVRQFFAAARDLQADALELLTLGDVRNAAEKPWGATRIATDALVLARTGERSRSGLRRAPRGSSCCSPRTTWSARPGWSDASTPARATCTATASTRASASPSTTPSAGSGRRPTTSMTPRGWRGPESEG